MNAAGPPVARTLDEANAIIAVLWEQNRLLRAEVAELRTEVADLKAQLARNSSNSSQPPSSDKPWNKPKRAPKSKPSGRKKGGQFGRKGHKRKLVVPELVDEVREVKPERCRKCGNGFTDEDLLNMLRHQVVELPAVVAKVLECRLWACHCQGCNTTTRATRPVDVPAGPFGPRLSATVALLTGRFRMSRSHVQQAMRDLFGVTMSIGGIHNVLQRVSQAAAPAVNAIWRSMLTEVALHADETGWRLLGERCWLWAATTPSAAVFLIDARRNREALKRLVPAEYAGIVHCDRWRPYELFDAIRRQLCHAHLRRDLQALIDRGGTDKAVGEALLADSNRMFSAWHRFGRGEIDRQGLRAVVSLVSNSWKSTAEQAVAADHEGKAKGFAKDLLRQWDALWQFAEHDGVEPTNNDVEQALRHAVIWRKTSFGNGSAAGLRFTERILTLVETARRRGVDLLDWLERLCVATQLGHDPPALVAA